MTFISSYYIKLIRYYHIIYCNNYPTKTLCSKLIFFTSLTILSADKGHCAEILF